MTMLKGKKTYIVAALMLLVGLAHGLTGDATGWAILWDNAQIILTGLGLAGLRAGVG